MQLDDFDGGFAALLPLVTCASTQGLQYGVDCSADSPPAPAPTAATELFVMERRRLRQTDATAAAATAGGGDGLFFATSDAAAAAGGAPPAPGAKAGRASTCRGYYRTVTLLTAVTLVATPPGIPDTASGYADPDWSLSLSPCGGASRALSLPVSATQWKEDARSAAPGAPPAWCAAWPALLAASSLAPAMEAGLNITLRSADDPAVVAGQLTACSGSLGESAGTYAQHGAVCIALGAALAAVGFRGSRRAASAQGHALGVVAPLATLKAAWASYGATAAAHPAGGWGHGVTPQLVVGTPAASGAARRRAVAPSVGVPAPPGAAESFDAVELPDS